MQPVVHVQESACGARFNPCYVEVLDVAETVDVTQSLNVIMLNK